MRFSFVLFCLLSLLTAGLYSQPAKAAPRIERAIPVAPPPAQPLRAGAVFRPGDIFEIRVTGIPAEDQNQFVNNPFTVSENGMISVPHIGYVRAAGLTQSDLEQAISRKFSEDKIFRAPIVNITVPQQARYVTIGGQVRAPSRVVWSADLTLLSGLTMAGGPADFASDKVQLIRGGKATTYSCKKLKKNPEGDPKLLPGDRVELLQ